MISVCSLVSDCNKWSQLDSSELNLHGARYGHSALTLNRSVVYNRMLLFAVNPICGAYLLRCSVKNVEIFIYMSVNLYSFYTF